MLLGRSTAPGRSSARHRRREADHRAVGMFEFARDRRRATRKAHEQRSGRTPACDNVSICMPGVSVMQEGPRSCPPPLCMERAAAVKRVFPPEREPRRTTSSMLNATGGFPADLPGLVIGAGGGGPLRCPEPDHWPPLQRAKKRGAGRRGGRWAGRRVPISSGSGWTWRMSARPGGVPSRIAVRRGLAHPHRPRISSARRRRTALAPLRVSCGTPKIAEGVVMALST